jgi:hypothetical protein
MEERDQWFANLKVGDEVGFYSASFQAVPIIRKVEAVTPSGAKRIGGELFNMRFKTGRSRWDSSKSVVELTPKMREQIMRKVVSEQAKGFDYSSLTTSALVEIGKILNAPESKLPTNAAKSV